MLLFEQYKLIRDAVYNEGGSLEELRRLNLEGSHHEVRSQPVVQNLITAAKKIS